MRLPASLEEFIVDQNTDTDGTTYTHIGSGNSYFIHNSVEEVIFDGLAPIEDPTLFISLVEFSAATGSGNGASLTVTGSADMSKTAGGQFYLEFEATRLADGGPELSFFGSRCRPIRWHPMEALSYIIWTPQFCRGPSSWQGILLQSIRR